MTETVEPTRAFIVTELGIYSGAAMDLPECSLGSLQTFPFLLITTATGKQTLRFIEAETGICCAHNSDLRV
jgi:hypothetical protein